MVEFSLRCWWRRYRKLSFPLNCICDILKQACLSRRMDDPTLTACEEVSITVDAASYSAHSLHEFADIHGLWRFYIRHLAAVQLIVATFCCAAITFLIWPVALTIYVVFHGKLTPMGCHIPWYVLFWPVRQWRETVGSKDAASCFTK